MRNAGVLRKPHNRLGTLCAIQYSRKRPAPRVNFSRLFSTRPINQGNKNTLFLISLAIGNACVLITNFFSMKARWGICRDPETCKEQGEIYWPRDGKCYPKLSRGPCPRGELLIVGEDGLATCSCSMSGELGRYHWLGNGGGCHEHYTKGPCTPGELFLPGGMCGCHSQLPHYHESSGMCYQLGEIFHVILQYN